MQRFTNEAGSVITDKLITVIQENKQYLSDIDGLIGDGDHGINMNKGFTMCLQKPRLLTRSSIRNSCPFASACISWRLSWGFVRRNSP